MCRRHVTYYWKALNESYNFALDRTSIRGLFIKLRALKSRESQLARFWDSHSGVSGEKNHLDVGFVERCRIYYKGENGGFPQVRAVVNLVCLYCSWLVLVPKVLQLCTNHLVWIVCKPMWMNEACQLFLVPYWSSNMPFYPSKCCELRNVPWLLPLSLSCTWIHFWVLQGVGSASFICT